MIRLTIRLLIPLVVIIVLLEALPVYGSLTSSGRLSASMSDQLSRQLPSYSVAVEFAYRPEYFQIAQLQKIGTVAGISGNSVRLIRMSDRQVREVADLYWVKTIVPANGP